MRTFLFSAVILAGIAAPAGAQLSFLGLKNTLVTFALKQISVPGELEITVDGVEEPEEGVTEIVGLKVADGRGVWLEIDGLSLRWDAGAILGGELVVERLAARGVDVKRRPDPAAVAVEINEDAEIARTDDDPFDWPRSPITTRIDELRLDGVTIASGVIADQSLAFNAVGALRDEGDEQSARLDLSRTDTVAGDIAFSYLRDFAAETLTLKLDAAEAAGGLVAALAGFPEDSASRARIDADGPLSDWAVTLSAGVDEVFDASGDATFSTTGRLAVEADLLIEPGPAIAPAAAAALAPRATLAAKLTEREDGVFDIEAGRIASAALELTADGSYAPDTGAADLDVALAALAPLADLVPGVDFERIGFTGRITGAAGGSEPQDLTATGAFALTALSTAPADVAEASLTGAVRAAGERIEAELDGAASGVRLDRLAPDAVGEITLGLDGAFENEIADLARFALTSPLLTVEASGQADLGGGDAALDYAVTAPDLAIIAAAYEANAAGALEAAGRLDGPLDAPRLAGEAGLVRLAFDGESYGAVRLRHDATFGTVPEGRIDVTADGSRYGPASIAARFRLEAPKLDLTEMRAAALGAQIAGAASVDLDTTLVDGAISITAPDLAPLAEIAGGPVAGAVSGTIALAARAGAQDADLDLAIDGFSGFGAAAGRVRVDAAVRDARGAPSATGELTAEGLAYAALEASVRRISFSGSGRDLTGAPSATGRLTVDGAAAMGATVARIDFDGEGRDLLAAPAAEGVLTLRGASYPAAGASVTELRVEGEGSDLAGAIAASAKVEARGLGAQGARIATLSAEGHVRDPLGGPEGALKATVSGLASGDARVARIALDAALDAAGALALDLGLREISAPGASVASADLTGRVEAALSDAPRLDLALDAGAADLGAATLTGAGATARGPLSAIDVTLNTRGEMAEGPPISLDAAARVNAAGAGPRADISLLEARYGEELVRLAARLRIAVEGGTTRFTGLDLELPGGGLSGDAALHPNGASGDLALRMDDLSIARRLADAPVEEGRIAAAARFDTRAGRAGAEVSLEATDLAFAGVETDGAGLGLTADATWDGRAAAIAAAIAGNFGDPIRIDGTIPLRPSGGPAPRMPDGAEIAARLDWTGDIGAFWALVPAPGHVLDGALDIDLRVAGTLDAPAISGELSLSGGRYENLDLGTILTDLTARTRVASAAAFAVDLSAEDGAGGAVTGLVEIADGALDARIGATNAILVRRDDAVAQVSLDIAAKGPLTGPDISGEVTIDRAEIRLVNATPPSVADLGEVRIKGAPIPEETPPAGGAIGLDLAIRAPDKVFVRGRGLDSEWMINLDVSGTAARPVIVGAIEKRRGRLDLLGRIFTLDPGRIAFNGSVPVDPTLDIALTRENGGVTGGVFIDGAAADPQISFRSTPALPEEEVLPRVLFGRSQQSLSGVEALQLAVGVATLLDGSGGALDDVRGAAGVDVLRFEQSPDGASSVTVGKNVADGVFVGVKQPIDGGSSSVQVEVELFEDTGDDGYGDVTVDSEVGRDAGASVGLNWRKDF